MTLTLELQARLEAAARQTRECGIWLAGRFTPCSRKEHCPCSGTGKVLRWPGISDTCDSEWCDAEGLEPGEESECEICSGSGRILKQGSDLLVAVRACIAQETDYAYNYIANDPLPHQYAPFLKVGWKVCKDTDELTAAVEAFLALAQAPDA